MTLKKKWDQKFTWRYHPNIEWHSYHLVWWNALKTYQLTNHLLEIFIDIRKLSGIEIFFVSCICPVFDEIYIGIEAYSLHLNRTGCIKNTLLTLLSSQICHKCFFGVMWVKWVKWNVLLELWDFIVFFSDYIFTIIFYIWEFHSIYLVN